MILTSPKDFLEEFEALQKRGFFQASTMSAALLVNPSGMAISAQSAQDNFYIDTSVDLDSERAHRQHQDVARKLQDLGVPVIQFSGLAGLDDGIYPNNVFGTVPGRFIIGKMFHQVRQQEATRNDIRQFFTEVLRYDLVDLSQETCSAELTGALVIDRSYQVGYCGLSNRADERGCQLMHEAFKLQLTLQFDLVPEEYHSNFVLAILAGRVCVLHEQAFADPEIPKVLSKAYLDRTIKLSDEEKNAFAANCIAVSERDVLMSQTSFTALSEATRAAFEANGMNLHYVDIDELEKAGGSLRCLIAEIF